MDSQELMLAAIGNGLEDDGTTAAALDAIREQSGCSLLSAVLEVARVHSAAKEARELTEAITYLAKDSSIREELEASIILQCFDIPLNAYITIVTIEGDSIPRADVEAVDWEYPHSPSATVTVGARWVKREASRLMVEHDRQNVAAECNPRLKRRAKKGGSR